jgi:hypothetical protein
MDSDDNSRTRWRHRRRKLTNSLRSDLAARRIDPDGKDRIVADAVIDAQRPQCPWLALPIGHHGHED